MTLLKSLPFRFALLVFGVALVGCAVQTQPEEEPTFTPFPTPVRPAYTVQRGDVVRQANFNGRVQPSVSTELFFARDGRVGQVYVAPGDDVRAGQLLADLSVLSDLQQEWSAASEQVRLQQEAARTIIRRAEIDLEIAQLTLDLYRTQGRSSFEVRIQELEVERAQMALDEVTTNVALQIDTETVKQLEAQMAEAQLFSPTDGTVIAAVDPGQSVRTSTTAFAIGDIRRLEVRANADEALLKELVEDMPVSVVLEAQPDQTFSGVIRELPYPYGSRSNGSEDDSIRIRLDASPPAAGFKLGDSARIDVVLGQKLDTLWLPPEAIRTAGGRTFVFVETDAGPQQVNIALGVQTLDRVEIVKGLSAGQRVIGP